jgi:GTP pyrophosphokinase
VTDCYRVLSLVHSHWNFIRDEFDDYITTPKENGYQSIHTVIIGPQAKTVEIQIRTYEMHQHAEHGIAAHWKYKEGGKGYDANLEASISNMRQLLENRSDSDVFAEISTELQSQNIYVLTPNNQIITLPQGATPLDFAYAIHTDLGHSCRGAKLNGKIIPLTQSLKTGDRVEILSIKNGEPNRNWLNPNLGYLVTSRARTRIKHWFNKRNRDVNIEAGEQLYQRELKRLNARQLLVKQLVDYFQLPNDKDFYEALGKGQINERQLVSAIQRFIQPTLVQHQVGRSKPEGLETINSEQPVPYVVGAPNLRTQIAPCCQPTSSDQIVGYVTRGRGITIHKSDCSNILNLSSSEQQRLIEVRWSDQNEESALFLMRLHILAFDRKGLLRDVMGKLTEFDVNLIRSNTHTDREERTVEMQLDLEVGTNVDLGALLDQIEALSNVEEVSIEQHNEQLDTLN